jgi:phage terminase large subunit-like protein
MASSFVTSDLLDRINPEALQNLDDDTLDNLLEVLEADQTEYLFNWDNHALDYQRLPLRDLAQCDWISREYGAGKVGNNDWNTVLWLCGRGAGKTMTIMQILRRFVESGEYKSICIVATTEKVLRESYALPLEKLSSPDCKARYIANQSKIVWPNDAQAMLLTAENTAALRSGNYDLLICDELCFWSRPEAYSIVRAALRVGPHPLCLIGTSPKSTPLIWSIVNDPYTVTIHASTYDNTTLSEAAIEALVGPLRGHPDYDAEILGRLYERIQGALWTRELIGANRLDKVPEGVELIRIVVGVDPGGFSSGGDEAGIVIAAKGSDDIYYVLADYSLGGDPKTVVTQMARAYRDYLADALIYESNQGGEYIRSLIDTIDTTINIKSVRAKVGKRLRAEPISALHNQSKIKFIGSFDLLESQMCNWTPKSTKSPDRLDAFVYAIAELSGRGQEVKFY